MSVNPSQPDLPESDEELESLLKKLEPTSMDVGQFDSLCRDYRLTASEHAHDPTRPQWRRVIPLTVACCLVMFVYGTFRYGSVFSSRTEVADTAKTSAVVNKIAKTAPTNVSESRFVPVSAQGFLVNASSGGVIDTEEGPRERMNVEYRDAYHWHDPETGTNIRFFQPRSEDIIVPLQTD